MLLKLIKNRINIQFFKEKIWNRIIQTFYDKETVIFKNVFINNF